LLLSRPSPRLEIARLAPKKKSRCCLKRNIKKAERRVLQDGKAQQQTSLFTVHCFGGIGRSPLYLSPTPFLPFVLLQFVVVLPASSFGCVVGCLLQQEAAKKNHTALPLLCLFILRTTTTYTAGLTNNQALLLVVSLFLITKRLPAAKSGSRTHPITQVVASRRFPLVLLVLIGGAEADD